MPTLLLPIGIQGSGKTTWRERQKKRYRDKIGIVSPDEIREITQNEVEVWSMARDQLDECLGTKPRCILDATNIVKKWRAMPISVAKNRAARVEGVYFDIHPRFAILRNSKRKRKVPENRIYLYHYQLLDDPPTAKEGFDSITVIPQRPNKVECAEMDGTVDGSVCKVFETIDLAPKK